MSLSDFGGTGNAGGEPRRIASPEPGLALWWLPLEGDDADLPAAWATLSAEEAGRARRFGTDALRHRYVVGRSALRRTLAQRFGIAPAAVPILRGARGRPMLGGGGTFDFNVSHTHGIVLIAHLERPGFRVGVDIERIDRSLSHDALATKFLTQRERGAIAPLDEDARRRAFLRLWTCKEAMSKATGDGLIAPFRAIGIDIARALRVVEGEGVYAPKRWTLHAVSVPAAHYATVAIWSVRAPDDGPH